jgi:hypothetical protein
MLSPSEPSPFRRNAHSSDFRSLVVLRLERPAGDVHGLPTVLLALLVGGFGAFGGRLEQFVGVELLVVLHVPVSLNEKNAIHAIVLLREQVFVDARARVLGEAIEFLRTRGPEELVALRHVDRGGVADVADHRAGLPGQRVDR